MTPISKIHKQHNVYKQRAYRLVYTISDSYACPLLAITITSLTLPSSSSNYSLPAVILSFIK